MGSFNMACKATNLSLTYGDPIVAFPVLPITGKHGRSEPGDLLCSSHHIVGWPIHGTYGDYGHIDTPEKTYGQKHPHDGSKPDELEYMMFHEFAFDLLKATVFKERARHEAWQAEYYADKPEPEWRAQERADLEGKIQEQEERVRDPENYEPRLWVNSRGHMFYAPEGEYPHEAFWRTAFTQSDAPRQFYADYEDKVGWIHAARYTFNFQISPSLYAGQEVELDGQIAMHSAALKYLEEQRAEYGE